MLQHVLKTWLLVALLGLAVQDANAFGRCGRGGCGWGGCGYGGCGGYGYGYGGYYGGGGYSGWGYGGYGAMPSGAYSSVAGNTAAPQPNTTSQPNPTIMWLTVNVPADAKVFINDRPTTSTGEYRQYFSTGLQLAIVYPYRVRAEFMRDGKPVSEERAFRIAGGQTASLNFNGPPGAQMADMNTSTQR